MTIVQIAQELGTELRRRTLGRQHYARTCELLAHTPKGELVVLDFTGVSAVTGSWLNAMLVPLMQWAANEQNDLFLVLHSFHDDWLDELRLVAGWNHECFLVNRGTQLPPRRATVVGPLEAGQRETLEAVLRSQEVTGAMLERQHKSNRTKATAWNNRLKDLFQKRLIGRKKRGREQLYSPVVREVVFDG